VELLKLYNFYRYRMAYLSGKVESFKLEAPQITEEEKARFSAIAQSYFELAESYILEDN
jgi:aminoglycoside phosphotransferase family enzyme